MQHCRRRLSGSGGGNPADARKRLYDAACLDHCCLVHARDPAAGPSVRAECERGAVQISETGDGKASNGEQEPPSLGILAPGQQRFQRPT
jgi:hypothetical protein